MIVMAQRHAQEFASRATQEAIEQRSQQRSHFAAAPAEDEFIEAEPAMGNISYISSPRDRRPNPAPAPAPAATQDSMTAPASLATYNVEAPEPPALAAPAAQASSLATVTPPAVHHGPLLAAAADLTDGDDGRYFDMQQRVSALSRELTETQKRLARACGEASVVRELDLAGLAALRTELLQTCNEALERIDDRRVELRCQAEAQKLDDSGLCVACLARNANALLQPCRHMCVCTVCAPQCGDVCPICRRGVQHFIEVVGVS